MTTYKVIWDPGHGGRDLGANSPSGLMEKDLVLDIARRIARLEAGFEGRVKFRFTRLSETDFVPTDQSFSVGADLASRARFANGTARSPEQEDRLFVSLHLNADASHTGRGLSVWHYPTSERGRSLSQALLGRLRCQLSPWVGLYGSGLFTADFHVLQETEMPAALIEAGFIGTPAEAAQLVKPVVRQHIAEGAVLGVAEHLGLRYIYHCDSDRNYEHFDWDLPSHATADELERAFAGTALAGLGSTFLKAEAEHDLHAVGFAALAAHESAWGASQIAQEKKNLFGYGATDDHPYGNARRFETAAEGVLYVGKRVRRDYLDPGGRYYHGANLSGMNVRYASDPNWRHAIAGIWTRIRPFEHRYGVPAPIEPTPDSPENVEAPAPPNAFWELLRAIDPAETRMMIKRLEQLLLILEGALQGAKR
jgi:N-acetylmuramoyl-L-alanine amidase